MCPHCWYTVSIMRELIVYRLGRVSYGHAYLWQRALAERLIGECSSDAMVIVEHPPVITMGRLAQAENVLASAEQLKQAGVELVDADRGGDVTYHGPGQFVAYPILNLVRYKKDLGWYLRRLEEVVVRVLADYGVDGRREAGFTGVWVGGEKVAAIGVAVRRWVTYHGVAINVTTNMDHFGLITPCGLSKPVTSLREILKIDVGLDDVGDRFVERFVDVFGIERVSEGRQEELAALAVPENVTCCSSRVRGQPRE
jgi:lipoyl(octanoyl) transferase